VRIGGRDEWGLMHPIGSLAGGVGIGGRVFSTENTKSKKDYKIP